MWPPAGSGHARPGSRAGRAVLRRAAGRGQVPVFLGTWFWKSKSGPAAYAPSRESVCLWSPCGWQVFRLREACPQPSRPLAVYARRGGHFCTLGICGNLWGTAVPARACVPGEGAQGPAVLPEGLLWGPPGLGQRPETPAPSTHPAFGASGQRPCGWWRAGRGRSGPVVTLGVGGSPGSSPQRCQHPRRLLPQLPWGPCPGRLPRRAGAGPTVPVCLLASQALSPLHLFCAGLGWGVSGARARSRAGLSTPRFRADHPVLWLCWNSR